MPTRESKELRQVRFVCAQQSLGGHDEPGEPSCCSLQLRTGLDEAIPGQGLQSAEHVPQSLVITRAGDGEHDSAAKRVERGSRAAQFVSCRTPAIVSGGE
ncbi:hypothetical protein C0J29_30525 (plasmid) [Mycobacterium paragordonae]|uniref:Uncharacterized protein n=1 Tax=Mycobacterium paragordonae TaxID=1389713 RepID=A0ABQ1CFA0_9MYCO|nr:hypothetical protein C0J29_30525 [Mycobacterium paragordonae]PJE25170.1 MAG: hypothetical protein CK431_02155 [Mycobacterium sp.]GFG82936.1 hypothetical protein MPRG_62120 [Mycobacterium paragordonae]